MIDLWTACLLSLASLGSIAVMLIGSTNRVRKLYKRPMIILPKSESYHKPFWTHRAFQMRRLSNVTPVDLSGQVCKYSIESEDTAAAVKIKETAVYFCTSCKT